ncbi:MAG: threonine--tRNA ligase [Thermoplasmata archaeon]|nr:threonine--tRNA ligase [Thermoplasmata archaeon]
MAAESIEIIFPDAGRRPFPKGTTAGQALADWKPEASRELLAARYRGELVDLSRPLHHDGSLSPVTFEDRAGKEILNHSAAHIVAKALIETIPEALPTVGPAEEAGFHYDFDVRPLTPEDLTRITAAVDRIVRANDPFHRVELPREEALHQFRANPHKQRYIQDAPPNEPVSIYRTGLWIDLCRGPHVPSTGAIGGLRLLGFSGLSAEGRPEGPILQRVRGIAFPTPEGLAAWERQRKEAEARDHRVLGERLELFTFVESAPGFPIWLPKGMIVVRELEKFVREHLAEAGYSEVRTPLLFDKSVFEKSGHWEHYKDNIFLVPMENRVYGLKPMNCPGSMLIFGARARSYRELPLRLAEFAPLHRLEASGTIHGLTRVREFVQDDAHIFVTEEQVAGEIRTLLAWIARAFSTFHLEWSYELSTRPANFLGEAAVWDRAEATLKQLLDDSKVAYRISPGEGAFYGPKIDIFIKDSIGRAWQTGTIQLDYQMPLRFGLQYQGPDGHLHTPIVVHRAILGTWERFFGVLLEHTAGRLPVWLSPVQVRLLPIGDAHSEAARTLAGELRARGLRVEVADPTESLGKRVRQAELDRVPYIGVFGDREVAEGTVTVRRPPSKEPKLFSRAEFVDHAANVVATRSFDP